MADFIEKLTQTWPAKIGRSFIDALTLPGDVYAGRTPIMGADGHTNPEVVNRSADLAGLIMGGTFAGVPARAGEAVLGAGPIRMLPADNYLAPLSKYTKRIYRETSPESALSDLPHSNVSASYGPGGAPRQFYADTPDLALGQGANKGVRIEYDASPFEGVINTKKPGWDFNFQNGSAEYIAAPRAGVDPREAVKSFTVDKNALAQAPRVVQAQFRRLVDRLSSESWTVSDQKEMIELARKYGLAGLAPIVAAAATARDFSELTGAQ